MDVEDAFGSLSDDAAMIVAQEFAFRGVRGSFCVTGEKCRRLMRKGREDVMDALRLHALGLHTNTHSQHPTTMELLENCGWDDGCQAAFESEKPGYDSFVEAFGRAPTFWGGAGNTWGPQVTDALKRMGIPAFVYSLLGLPGPHRYNGVMGFPQVIGFPEATWSDKEATAAALAKVKETVASSGQPVTLVFVGHPTKMRYKRFWDGRYGGGRTRKRWRHPAEKEEDFQRAIAGLGSFLGSLRMAMPIVGMDEVLEMPWQFRPAKKKELELAREQAAANLAAAAGWPIHKPGLDTSRLVELTLERLDSLEIASL
jgi:hypothetical protein